jgi:hypothetical protein
MLFGRREASSQSVVAVTLSVGSAAVDYSALETAMVVLARPSWGRSRLDAADERTGTDGMARG